jgi:hypothetical protein
LFAAGVSAKALNSPISRSVLRASELLTSSPQLGLSYSSVAEGFEVAVCWRRDLDGPFIEPFIAAARHALR